MQVHDQSGPSKKHFKKYLPKQQVENTAKLHLHFTMDKEYLKSTSGIPCTWVSQEKG